MKQKKAPQFCLKDSFEKNICLKDYLGKKVVIYFYPRDNTPGCTLEAIDFTSLLKDFEKLNTVIIGISKDSCSSHKKFIEKQNLKVILLSDPDHKVQEKFKVWRPKKFMGREFMGTVRSTFLIDENQKIIKEWDSISAKGHAKEVLEYIKNI